MKIITLIQNRILWCFYYFSHSKFSWCVTIVYTKYLNQSNIASIWNNIYCLNFSFNWWKNLNRDFWINEMKSSFIVQNLEFNLALIKHQLLWYKINSNCLKGVLIKIVHCELELLTWFFQSPKLTTPFKTPYWFNYLIFKSVSSQINLNV